MKPTRAQQQYLLAIRDLADERGFPPTLGEVGERLGGITKHGVLDMVRRLERHGLVSKCAHTARSLMLTRDGAKALAGSPGRGC